MTLATVARRPREGHRWSASLLGLPLAGAGAVADARGRRRCGGCGPGSRGWRSSSLVLALYPTRHRAALQQVHAAARRPGARAHRGAARALRLRVAGPVRDGRLEALEPRQRVLHRLRHAPSASCSSTRCSRASRPTRSRRCSRTSSATSSCSHVAKRIAWSAVAVARASSRCSRGSRRRLVLPGLGVPTRAAAIARPASRSCCSSSRCRCSRSCSRRSRRWYSRRHEFEADAFAAQHASAARARRRRSCKLYEDNAATLTPDPLHSAFYDSHPPAALRVARICKALAAARAHERRRPAAAHRCWSLAAAGIATAQSGKPYASGNAEAGAMLSQKDCVGCHARKFDGDATRIYTRAGPPVRTPAQLLAQVQLLQHRASTAVLPRGRSERRRLPRPRLLPVLAMATPLASARRHAGAAAARRGSPPRPSTRRSARCPAGRSTDGALAEDVPLRRLARDDGVRERGVGDRATRRPPSRPRRRLGPLHRHAGRRTTRAASRERPRAARRAPSAIARLPGATCSRGRRPRRRRLAPPLRGRARRRRGRRLRAQGPPHGGRVRRPRAQSRASPAAARSRRSSRARSLLYRSDAFREKVIAANVTQVVGVVAPDIAIDENLLNRWIIAAEARALPLRASSRTRRTCPASTRCARASRRTRRSAIRSSSARPSATSRRSRRACSPASARVLDRPVGHGQVDDPERAGARRRRAHGEVSAALGGGRHTTT